MRFRTILRATLSVILLSILSQACTGTGNRSTASSTSRSDFTAETRLEVDQVEIKPIMNSNVLRIKEMNLDAGQLVFRLSSPDGQVRWQESFTGPASFKRTFDLEVVPGTWKLEIELQEATGNYVIEWRASN